MNLKNNNGHRTVYADSHAHMSDPAFDNDRASVLAKIKAKNVVTLVEIGCSPKEWEDVLKLAKLDDNYFCALGFHPINADSFSSFSFDTLSNLAKSESKIKAIGEIGIDYAYNVSKKVQREVFGKCLQLADELEKPLVLHCRKNNVENDFSAYEDLFAIMKDNWKPMENKKFSGILHCFSGRAEDAKKAIDNNLLIGINAIVGYKGKKSAPLREIVKEVGVDNIVLETDCPYLPPQSIRGKRNDPSYIPEIAQTLADILNCNIKELADKTYKNTLEVYQINN